MTNIMKALALIPVMFFSACLYFDPAELDGNPPRGYLAGTLIALGGLDLSCTTEGGALRYYVNSAAPGGDGLTWAGATRDLKTAINIAPSGAEIWVAAGVYRAGTSGDTSGTFTLRNNVAIYGGFQPGAFRRCQRNWRVNKTVLSGDLDGDDTDVDGDGVITSTSHLTGTNSTRVVTADDTDRTARLDGFYITAGDASAGDGAGIRIINGSPTLVNLVVIANRTPGVGGGIYNRSTGSGKTANPIIANAAIVGNEVTGGMDGGGMYNHATDMSTAAPLIINTIFFGNTAADEGGGMMDQACTNSGTTAAVYQNVVFAGNTAVNGGGIRLFMCGGGIAVNSRFLNTIFHANNAGTGPNVSIELAANVRFQNSLIEGGIAAIALSGGGTTQNDGGILSADPLLNSTTNFLGADNIAGTADDGPRIASGTPALNTGTANDVADLDGDGNTSEPIPDVGDIDGDGDTTEPMPLDFSGLPRFVDTTIDIGAYEFQ